VLWNSLELAGERTDQLGDDVTQLVGVVETYVTQRRVDLSV